MPSEDTQQVDDEAAVNIVAELSYKDPDAAIAWLGEAFGFETTLSVRDENDRLVFAQVGWGAATVAIVPEQGASHRSPVTVEGVNTQTVRVRSTIDVAAHCARARAAGARIVREPEMFFFGDLTYFVADLEDHIWVFAQRVPGAAGPPPEGWTVSLPARHTRSRKGRLR